VAVAAYSASTGDIIYSIVNMLLFSLGFSFTLLILAFVLSKMNLEKIIIIFIRDKDVSRYYNCNCRNLPVINPVRSNIKNMD
jgi:cytochrome c biogenesis protein CcdA